MIRIEITDPESIDKKALRGIAEYLLSFTNDRYTVRETIQTVDPEKLKEILREPEGLTELPPVNPFQPAPLPKVPEPVYAVMGTGGGTPTGVELDTRGFPWNDRIHSRMKSKNKDGSWKYQRSVSPRLITEVENEIMGIVPPPPPAPPPPPSIPAGVAQMDLMGLMDLVSNAIGDGKLFRADIHPILSKFGIASLTKVAEHPDKIPAIAAALTEVIKNAS